MGGTQERKFNFVRNIFSFTYQWGYTGKKINFVKNILSSLINGSAQEIIIESKKKLCEIIKLRGLRWYNFTSTCPIMVIFKIYDLRVGTFRIMYHMWVYLKLLKSLHVLGFEME